MMCPLISIIVPVYNVEKYLCRCLDSILQQTYTNLEVILVDDGSLDNCPHICDKYAVRDNRVRVIHKTNGGLSSARNVGLDIANGEWVGFVDSDDWILPDMYEKLYSAAICENADLAICGYIYIDENNIPSDGISLVKDEILEKSDAFNKLIEKKSSFYVTAFNKIYAKKIFNNLRFPLDRLHEDEFTIHSIFNECRKIVAISDILYMYVQREDSIMHKKFSIKRFDYIDAIIERYNFFRLQGLNRHGKLTLRRAYHFITWRLDQLEYDDHKNKIESYYNKVFWLLVKTWDLYAIKLFVFRYKNMFVFLRYIKKWLHY